MLQKSIQKGDIELIKIYLSETIKNETGDLTFKIDKRNKTASLYKINNEKKDDDFIISRTIKHEREEYLITSICRCQNFNINRVKFDTNPHNSIRIFFIVAY